MKCVKNIVKSMSMMANYPTKRSKLQFKSYHPKTHFQSIKMGLEMLSLKDISIPSCIQYLSNFLLLSRLADTDNGLKRDWEIKFISKNDEVNQEYLIYDITGFVGSVGGTLGLFIGFSFRDIVELILDLGQNLF